MTVGYIHGGTKNNIIPDFVEMGLTVRTYDQSVRAHILNAITRIAKSEAEAAGAETLPKIERYEFTDAVENDPGLSEKLRVQEKLALGENNVIKLPPGTGSEDYSIFVAAGVPSVYFDLGAANQKVFDEAKAAGRNLPSLHSSLFAPDIDPALHTGIAAEVTALRTLLR